MTAPRKGSPYNQTEFFSLKELLTSLDFKLFRELLPRGTKDVETLYYKPEALLKALLLRALLGITYRDLETFLWAHPSYAKACGFVSGTIPHSSYY
ncbi:MAG: transposase [Candidatus Hodarchaeales archaeon]